MNMTPSVISETDRIAADHEHRTDHRIAMSYDDFLTKLDDTTHAEWANGEATIFMPPNTRHQEIVVFLLALLEGFVKIYDLGKMLVAPFEMRLENLGASREPDLLFVAKASIPCLAEARLNGPADLIVEVISDSSTSRDRAEKFYEYQTAGVREYWIIDPRPRYERADFWVLDANGKYQPVPINSDGVYESTVLPNFKLHVPTLLADPLPSPLKALADMVGTETLLRALGQDQ